MHSQPRRVQFSSHRPECCVRGSHRFKLSRTPASAPCYTPTTPSQNRPCCLARIDWLVAASTIPGKGLHLALLLHSLCSSRPCPSVKLTRRMLEQGNVSRDASYDGLRRLQAHRLVTVRRLPGRSPQILLLEPGTDQALEFTKMKDEV